MATIISLHFPKVFFFRYPLGTKNCSCDHFRYIIFIKAKSRSCPSRGIQPLVRVRESTSRQACDWRKDPRNGAATTLPSIKFLMVIFRRLGFQHSTLVSLIEFKKKQQTTLVSGYSLGLHSITSRAHRATADLAAGI